MHEEVNNKTTNFQYIYIYIFFGNKYIDIKTKRTFLHNATQRNATQHNVTQHKTYIISLSRQRRHRTYKNIIKLCRYF